MNFKTELQRLEKDIKNIELRRERTNIDLKKESIKQQGIYLIGKRDQTLKLQKMVEDEIDEMAFDHNQIMQLKTKLFGEEKS